MASVIGAMRTRVQIGKVTETQDAAGQPVKSWSTLATVYGKVRPGGTARFDHEFMQAHAEVKDADTIVEIRHRDDITTKHRLAIRGHFYDIQFVDDKYYNRRFLIILATRGKRYIGETPDWGNGITLPDGTNVTLPDGTNVELPG